VENMAKIVKNIETTHFYQHKNEPIEKISTVLMIDLSPTEFVLQQ
jgi:hypothetical protein